MDNLCHTLAGLALGEAGLKNRSRFASATLMIGANLPDVDGFVYFFRPEAALGFRRGWTHGILAMAIWPFVLSGIMYAIARLRKADERFRDILLLAAVSVLSHPLLDLMNVYGVRLLMPFSGHWFYADTLFIVDPWIWIALIVGIQWSRRTRSPRPMRGVLVAIGAYIAGMAALGLAGRTAVRADLAAQHLAVERVMVAPVVANPLNRDVIAQVRLPGQADVRYLDGALAWKGHFVFTPRFTVARGDTGAAARAAARAPRGRGFLRWSRFPFYSVGPSGCARGYVCIGDMRYQAPWAEVAVPVAQTLPLQP